MEELAHHEDSAFGFSPIVAALVAISSFSIVCRSALAWLKIQKNVGPNNSTHVISIGTFSSKCALRCILTANIHPMTPT